MAEWIPPDQEERDRIERALDTNLLVEAGAGSGKTTAMVGRMIELIRTGTAEVGEIAAVTFTRKAAAELKERFQIKLEESYRKSSASASTASATERERFSRALSDLDRAFVGTIHSFCARLLRERPLEAKVPPNFQEISGADEEEFRAESWNRFLERLAVPGSRLAVRLAKVGIRPAQLRGIFEEVSNNPDVCYHAPRAEAPSPAEIDRVRKALREMVDESRALMPPGEPHAGWDNLQRKVRELRFSSVFPGWTSDVHFLDALSVAVGSGNGVTQNRWLDGKAAKALGAEWEAFGAEGGMARRLLDKWLAHRYPVVIRAARAAAGHYKAERLRAGLLDFQDLLLLTRDLLKDHPETRRELGERYRRLLVDEFQDTDPIQAEIIFLLAAEPVAGVAWQSAVPRPGSLFVVGDPKQSIYRFRRADISVYNQVKARFREFGAVLDLVANFRSTVPIANFVNSVFVDLFPAEESAHQAGFAPLSVNPGRVDGAVLWYGFEPAPGRGRFTGRRVAEPDIELLASWVQERIDAGAEPGEFMVLTWTKSQLSAYARALEERNIPVQVSGAGVGMDEELAELILLLRALGDPGDPVLTVAVLEGLFHGISHEELYQHIRAGGTFSFLREDQPPGPVGAALRQLWSHWRLARNAPADVVVPMIVERLGILPNAAAGDLGATRTGALLYALDALRVAGLEGKTTLAEAVEVLERALGEEVDTPLEPGETNAVRLMNLHKAKGLEAPTVILAYPAAGDEHPVQRYIARDETGRAVGYLPVLDSSRWAATLLAQPLDWRELAEKEAEFLAAERVRLGYVAATRAGTTLVVSRCTKTEERSPWTPFHQALDNPEIASELSIRVSAPPAREELTIPATEIEERGARLEEARAALAEPSYEAASVTARVRAAATTTKEGAGEPVPEAVEEVRAEVYITQEIDRSEFMGVPRGPEWGTVVHRALEVADQGAEPEVLERLCRGLLIEAERPLDSLGEPVELSELVELVQGLHGSTLWQRARRAEPVLHEAPFAIAVAAEDAARLGLVEERGRGAAAAEEPAPTQVIEGVIDLAFRESDGGWVIGDYKTDIFPDERTRHERTTLYRRQVDLYANCWAYLTGEPVKERVLIFTGEGREEAW